MLNNFRNNIAKIISAPVPVKRGSSLQHRFYLRASSMKRTSINPVSKPLKKEAAKRSFVMASLSRLTNDWIQTARSINFDLSQGLSIMRARGLDIAMNDPVGRKYNALLKKNVIGPLVLI